MSVEKRLKIYTPAGVLLQEGCAVIRDKWYFTAINTCIRTRLCCCVGIILASQIKREYRRISNYSTKKSVVMIPLKAWHTTWHNRRRGPELGCYNGRTWASRAPALGRNNYYCIYRSSTCYYCWISLTRNNISTSRRSSVTGLNCRLLIHLPIRFLTVFDIISTFDTYFYVLMFWHLCLADRVTT